MNTDKYNWSKLSHFFFFNCELKQWNPVCQKKKKKGEAQKETCPGLVNKTEGQNNKQADTDADMSREAGCVCIWGIGQCCNESLSNMNTHLNCNNKDHNKVSHIYDLLHCSESPWTPNCNLWFIQCCKKKSLCFLLILYVVVTENMSVYLKKNQILTKMDFFSAINTLWHI